MSSLIDVKTRNFENAVKGLKISIHRILGDVEKKRGSLRSSTYELGKKLVELRTKAKKYGQSFSNVVESAPINLPRRSAYNYIAGYEKAGKLPTSAFAKIESAGFDPTQTRILKKVNHLLKTKRFNRMSLVQLSAKLEKGVSRTSPRSKAKRLLKNAISAFLTTVKDLSYIEARKQLVDWLEPILHRQIDSLKKSEVKA